MVVSKQNKSINQQNQTKSSKTKWSLNPLKIGLLFISIAAILSVIVLFLNISPQNRLELARKAYANDQFDTAVKHYQKIGLDNLGRQDLIFLADSYLNLNQSDQAKKIQDKLKEKFSSDPQELLRQANTALAAGDKENAQQLFNQAIVQDNQLVAAYRGLADILAGENKLEEAYKLFEQAATDETIKISILLELAVFAKNHGNVKKANETYYEVFKLDPNNQIAKKHLFFEPDNSLEPKLQVDDLYLEVPQTTDS